MLWVFRGWDGFVSDHFICLLLLFFFGVCSPGIHDFLVHDTPSAKGRMPNMRISTLYFYQYDPNMPNSRSTLCFFCHGRVSDLATINSSRTCFNSPRDTFWTCLAHLLQLLFFYSDLLPSYTSYSPYFGRVASLAFCFQLLPVYSSHWNALRLNRRFMSDTRTCFSFTPEVLSSYLLNCGCSSSPIMAFICTHLFPPFTVVNVDR